jgi:uncharacterized protein (TIGR00304 family)
MSEWNLLITIGIILIVLGLFLAVFWTIMRSVQAEHEYDSSGSEKTGTKIKGGGVIMIGPIPIVLGSDRRFALIAMILAIVILLLMIVFLKKTA